jgi:hypothetical protein
MGATIISISAYNCEVGYETHSQSRKTQPRADSSPLRTNLEIADTEAFWEKNHFLPS